MSDLAANLIVLAVFIAGSCGTFALLVWMRGEDQ